MRSRRQNRKAARALYRLCLVDGVLDPGRVRIVAGRLASSGRRDALSILAEFRRRVRLDVQRHAAVVTSAAPLPDSVREAVEAGLARRYGVGIQTSFSEDPSLIGGMRVTVGSDVYDGSVRARLAALEARF
jgi:F-type H+-transporting ATPase subunit delta